jgi:sRNA-binding carbon storage regulator CsrA
MQLIHAPVLRFGFIIPAMLVMKRAAGEAVLIGDDLLTIDQVSPSVLLQFNEAGQVHNYRFPGGSYPTNESMLMGSCRVVLMAVGSTDVTLGFDAPRSVRIVRTELPPLDDTSKPPPDQR